MRWGVSILLVLVATVAIAGYAIGAGGSSKNLVLCASKKSRDVSLATAKGKCAKGEEKLTVAKEGPVGPVGAVGPAGPQGAAGSDANATLEAVHYVTGPPNDECFAKTATFCKGSLISGGWRNFSGSDPSFENVGFYKEPNGTVHLVGTTEFGSSGGESGGYLPPGPFFLPPGYRPSKTRAFAVPGSDDYSLGGFATVEVRPDGAVAIPGTANAAALDGISFRVP